MIKRLNWPIWLIIIFLLLLSTFTYGRLAKAIQNISVDKALSVQVNSKQIDSDVTLQSETKEVDLFTSFVTYPKTKIETIDVPIYKWVLKQEELFYDEIEQTEMLLNENIKAHFNVQTKTYKMGDNIYSFVITAEQFADNVNEYSSLQTFIIDLKKQKFIDIADILSEEIIENGKLFSLIKDNITEKEIKEKIDDVRLKNHISELQQLKWALEKDHIHFYFNPGEIGDHAHIINSKIAIKHLHNYVHEKYKSILISEEIAKEIKEPRILDPKGKYIALTFDDGPSKDVTPRILRTLKKYDAKATFFMLGQNAKRYPKLAKQVADEGHEIANHTISHPNLTIVSSKRIKKELDVATEQIEKATGITPTMFRPPYGEFNKKVMQQAKKSEQAVILWSIDTLDWKYRNAKTVYKRTMKSQAGSIVLMHDIHPTTADALPKILKDLSEEGFEFVTVTELLPLLDGDEFGPYYGN